MTALQIRRALRLLRMTANTLPCIQEGEQTCRGLGIVPAKWCASCEAHQFLEELDEHQPVRRIRRRT